MIFEYSTTKYSLDKFNLKFRIYLCYEKMFDV